MAVNTRRDWHERLKAVEAEFAVAGLAVAAFRLEAESGRVRLPHPLGLDDIRQTAGNLHGTYLLRVVAEFEAALRSYWGTIRDTEPPLFDVINGLASRRRVDDELRVAAHAVREDRNRMIHETGGVQPQVGFSDACRRLHAFLSRLPDRW
jgi:hypothetical protein